MRSGSLLWRLRTAGHDDVRGHRNQHADPDAEHGPTDYGSYDGLPGPGIRGRVPRLRATLASGIAQLVAEVDLPMWVDVLVRLHNQGPIYDVFVVVGLDATNIYSLTLDGQLGQPVTVLCLEAVDAHRAGLQRLIARESHHWARQSALSHVTAAVGERLVSEGLAAVFSEEICPGLHPASYCYVPEDTTEWVDHHRSAL